ncbi:MAG: hypothetical protein AAF502_12030 [Bacteroidota bacterium]
MPISQTDLLFKLIKSLTKAEKRNFRLYVNRIQSGEKGKFVRLFDLLDKMSTYSEEVIYKNFKGLNKAKFSNLKRHLYSQILTSLRMINIQKHIDIQIREQIDFAKILYEKGLHLQALKLLERTKNLAYNSHQDYLHLEVLEIEKMIHSRHITRSKNVETLVDDLALKSHHRSKVIFNIAQLTNLKLKMHAHYIQKGHAATEADILEFREMFEANLPGLSYNEMTFFERIYFHQSHVWFHLTVQNHIYCYKHASNWVGLFNAFPDMKEKDPNLYMRGLHYMLIAAYNMGYYARFMEVLRAFEEFKEPQSKKLRPNARILSFIYRYTSRLNQHFMEGSFDEGLYLAKRIRQRIKRYRLQLDVHRIMVFYYKIACLYLGCEMPGKAIDMLNRVIDIETKHLREDIQVYSRLLFLVAHYEAGNFLFLEHQIKSSERFLNRTSNLSLVQKATLRFFSRLIKVSPEKKDELFQALYEELIALKKNPFEQRSFSYLDLSFWAKSKLLKVPMKTVIQRHFRDKIQKSGKLNRSNK